MLTGIPEHRGLRRLSLAFLRQLSILLGVVVAVALLSILLVRLAPGFGMDESQLDLRLSNQQVAEAGKQNLTPLDWSISQSLRRPIRELVAERAGLSLRNLSAGLLTAWVVSFGAALVLAWLRWPALDVCATLATGAGLCLPAAIVALSFLYVQAPPSLAITAILVPRIFRYVRNILHAASQQPHVMAARARGARVMALLLRHICRPAAPELLALLGVSISMAVSAMIPVEALCDSPGIGQLVWQSAAARDLPVLVHLTVLIAIVTCGANLLSDTAGMLLAREVS